MFGQAMMYAAAVSLPLLLAAAVVAAMLRRHGRHERAVWLLALTLALVVPVAFLFRPPEAEPAPVTAWPMQADVVVAPSSVSMEAIQVAPSTVDVDPLLFAAWLLGSLALVLHWAVAARRLAKASRSWQAETIDGVPTWVTADVGPAVSGTFRPRVLVPRWMLAMSEERRSLILRHEMEHIRAKDPLLVAFTRFARILAPWNPVVWILGSRLVRAIELDCDRRVLEHTGDVGAYGQTLLALSARRPVGLAAAAAFAESEASFRSRILALTTPSRPISVAALAASTVLGVVLIVGMLQIPVPSVSLSLDIGGTEAAEVSEQMAAAETPLVAAAAGSEWTPPEVFLTASQVTPLNGDEMNAAFLDYVLNMRTGYVVGGELVTVDPRLGWGMQIWLNVGASGRVIEVRTSDAWGITDADRAGIAQLYLRALFEPARVGGMATPFWLRLATVGSGGMALHADRIEVAQPSIGQAVPERDRPLFTPMSVRPALLNGAELAPAFSAAVPTEMRAAGTPATTLAWLYIATDGSVQRTAVIESSGNAAFDAAAQEVARRMRFSPALNRDQAVPVWVQVPLTFRPVAGAN